jgi:glycosyltransferase involved in cell wall biosynthesis
MFAPEEDAAAKQSAPRIAVVIPAFRETQHVLDVLGRCGDEVARIYVVDDGCPDGTGRHVESHCRDPRVRVLFHRENRGVGAATVTGYLRALADGADVLVKVDGDGQMDPAMIPRLVAPILRGEADYVKGNRFHRLDGLRAMPLHRLFGNAVLSFVSKISTGYWNIFDPTNGFTALHAAVARDLPLERVSPRFFFESDMLFHLNTVQAAVMDVPMSATYGDERSSLNSLWAVLEFSVKHLGNAVRRVFYNYYLRNFNVASLQILAGTVMVAFGTVFGAVQWIRSERTGELATTGTVMLAALPILVGVQLLLAFASYDMSNVPTRPIHPRLPSPRQGEADAAHDAASATDDTAEPLAEAVPRRRGAS